MSQSIASLAKALIAFQKEVPAIEKTAQNPFFHSNYAPLDAIIAATKPALIKNGLAVSQIPSGDNRLITVLMHESGEYVGDETSTSPAKQDPQGIGSAITYMRRYAYCAILGIAAEDDDDGNEASKAPSRPITANKPMQTSQGTKTCQNCGKAYVPKPGTESFSTVCLDCYKKSKSAPRVTQEEPPINYDEQPPF